MRKKVIDSFLFFNEYALCKLRLQLLSPFVDAFVIVEANHTFSGNQKPLNFPSFCERELSAFGNRIVYVPVQLNTQGLDLQTKPSGYDPGSGFFQLETQHRNAITTGLKEFSDNDLLLISDVDEIPNPERLQPYLSQTGFLNRLPMGLQQYFFYYKMRYLRLEDWRGTVITSVGHCRKHSPQAHRDRRFHFHYLPNAGWHFSYFGNLEFIQNKLWSFAHQEYNCPPYTDEKNISHCLSSGSDLLGRDVKIQEVEKTFFPPQLLELSLENPEFYW